MGDCGAPPLPEWEGVISAWKSRVVLIGVFPGHSSLAYSDRRPAWLKMVTLIMPSWLRGCFDGSTFSPAAV